MKKCVIIYLIFIILIAPCVISEYREIDNKKIINKLELNVFYGKYRGIVYDNNDPLNQGRIKAIVPSVFGDEVSDWALPCVPYAGDGCGMFMMPDIGNNVWIEFEGGNISYPIWVGCFWESNGIPKDWYGNYANPSLKLISTDNQLMIWMDENTKRIGLGKNAEHNMVLGNELVKYLNGFIELYNNHFHLAIGYNSELSNLCWSWYWQDPPSDSLISNNIFIEE